jgi:hypothetical protein
LPGFGDHYLARTGYKSQMRDQSRDPNQPDNLFAPADEEKDYGAHGAFDDCSIDRSYEMWVSEHLPLVATGVTAGLSAAVAVGLALTIGRRS